MTRAGYIAGGFTGLVLVLLLASAEDDGSIGAGQAVEMTRGALYQGRIELPTPAEAAADRNPDNPPLERTTDNASAAQIASELARLGFAPDVVVFLDAVLARTAVDPSLLGAPSRSSRWFSGVWTGPTGPAIVSPSGRIVMLRRIG